MIQKTKPYVVVLLAMTSVFSGCHPMQPFYFHDDGDLSHYLDSATQVEHPDYDQPRLAEVEQAMQPFVVSNPDVQEMWDLTLEECVGIALQNSKVIRNAGSIQGNFGFSDALIERVATLATILTLRLRNRRRRVRRGWSVLRAMCRHRTAGSIAPRIPPV